MSVPKPTLPATVYDALVKAESPLIEDYNRAKENEPAAAVAVVINVNLDYQMGPVVASDGRGRSEWTMPPYHHMQASQIAATAEGLRKEIARVMRGETA